MHETRRMLNNDVDDDGNDDNDDNLILRMISTVKCAFRVVLVP